MILAAFFISTAVVLLALGVIQAGRRAAHERERRFLESEVDDFLDDPKVPDAEHATGLWRGMPVRITVEHFVLSFDVTLTPAVVPYKDLMAKFAPGLGVRLAALGLRLDEHDKVHGEVPRETSLPENLVALEQRLPLVEEVRQLRSHAPGELVERIERARSSYEIDGLLIELTKHFPDAPETIEAIELAAERDHAHPERVRERAERWLGKSPAEV
ncbi:MAG: hypothetical protein U1F43_00605 [Myxococcota bacterium]